MMASINRRPPLAAKPPQTHPSPAPSPLRQKSSQSSKRPRSPDSANHNIGSLIKKLRPSASVMNLLPGKDSKKERRPEQMRQSKEQLRAEREQQRLEFKEKYCRAFPHWSFYFDQENMDVDIAYLESFKLRIEQLGGKIELFFSSDITHFVSNAPIPPPIISSEKEKENMKVPLSRPSKSPVKMRGRQLDEEPTFDLMAKALKFNIKIWNTTKLESVLSRCLEEIPTTAVNDAGLPNLKSRNPNTLSKLLQSERIHGLSERDPSQKRHDYHYFSRGSYFVLIEDMRGELATIVAHEYPPCKEQEAEKTPWPTLYCHPQARGPFIRFDEREKRRWERLLQAEQKENEEKKSRKESFLKKQLMEQPFQPRPVLKKVGDLRRSVSMNNLQRNTRLQMLDHDGEADGIDSVNASGYLASGVAGYVAASGNSVGITSATGTTSTAGYTSRNLQISSAFSGQLRREVIMRKQPSLQAEKLKRSKTMGPPAEVPQRSMVLRKSKSTNTMKLPKREEGSKPGYCESCRQKFNNFKEHINSRRHIKFAEDDSNFLQLDYILGRIKRRTLVDTQALSPKRFNICQPSLPPQDDSFADIVR